MTSHDVWLLPALYLSKTESTKRSERGLNTDHQVNSSRRHPGYHPSNTVCPLPPSTFLAPPPQLRDSLVLARAAVQLSEEPRARGLIAHLEKLRDRRETTRRLA